MTLVEHDRVAQPDRALEIGVGHDEIEQFPGTRAVGAIPGHQVVPRHVTGKSGMAHDVILFTGAWPGAIRVDSHATAVSVSETSTTRKGGRSGNAAASTGIATLYTGAPLFVLPSGEPR